MVFTCFYHQIGWAFRLKFSHHPILWMMALDVTMLWVEKVFDNFWAQPDAWLFADPPVALDVRPPLGPSAVWGKKQHQKQVHQKTSKNWMLILRKTAAIFKSHQKNGENQHHFGPGPGKKGPGPRSKASLQPASRLIMSWESQQVQCWYAIWVQVQKNEKQKHWEP